MGGRRIQATQTPQEESLWWNKPKADVGQALTDHVCQLRKDQPLPQSLNLQALCLYEGQRLTSIQTSAAQVIVPDSSTTVLQQSGGVNVIRSICDAIFNRITHRQPAPKFLTSGARYKLKRQAKQLEKLCLGAFSETDLYKKTPQVFLDGITCGTGFLKVFEEKRADRDGKIRPRVTVKRVFTDEITVDAVESVDGAPQSMYQTTLVSKQQLVAQYGKAKELEMVGQPIQLVGSQLEGRDYVECHEGWHLPSMQGAKDGRHVVSVGDVVLLDETWTLDKFPFCVFKCYPRHVGFFARGIPNVLRDIQLQIKKTMVMIDMALQFGSAPHWIVKKDTIFTAHLDNRIGSIFEYEGAPPEWKVWQAVCPDLWRQLNWLYDKAFELIGISQLYAQSRQNAGESGAARDAAYDTESERFSMFERSYEDMHKEAARLIIETIDAIAERDGSYEVTVRGDSSLDKLDWKDIDLENERYDVDIYSVSKLPRDPAGRYDLLAQWAADGLIDKSDVLPNMEMPDLDDVQGRYNSAATNCDRVLENMLDKGEAEQPEPFDDLQYSLTYMLRAYREAKNDGHPDDRLQLIRNYVLQLIQYIKDAQKNAAPSPGSAGPSPAPTSPQQA